MTAASTGRRLEEVFVHGREASIVTIGVAIGCAILGGGISGGTGAIGAAILCIGFLEPTSSTAASSRRTRASSLPRRSTPT